MLMEDGNLGEELPPVISMLTLPHFNERDLHKPDYSGI